MTLLADVGGFEILIIVAFIALVIVGVIYSAKAARERREALQAFANDAGLNFDSSDVRGAPPGTILFGVFNTGSDRRSSNLLTGTRACANGRSVGVTMGDYQYTTQSGSGENRSTTTHHLSFALMRLPFAVAERLAVRREGFLDKIAGAIGFEDIDFESAEFSRRYHISSSDRKVAYDLFDPRMIEWCMANEIPPTEIRGDLMLVCDQRSWKPEEFRAKLDWITEFVGRWPEHLVERLEGRA